MIEVKDLVKIYGDHAAVNHLSFTVEPGQIYGFLGPNGAGKSTTMNIMTGYLAATSGEVIINGHDILEEPEEAKKCIGYLPEIPPLYVDMTVQEYLDFAAELKGISKKERIKNVEEAISATHLEEMRGRLIKNLSKGYKQRVGLAQAILGYPEVIILDEPTVGLDPKQIIEIRDLIKELSENHTIILSSHILSEVSAVCDHIMIISHGSLVASDTPENLQKMMQNTAFLDVEAKANEEQLDAILAQFPQIEERELHMVSEEICHAHIKTDTEQGDIREELFYALAEAHCPLMQLRTETTSLEDVFLELTGAEQEEKAAQEAEAFEDAKTEDVIADAAEFEETAETEKEEEEA
ncbi:MAG: ABC transporter ATP-binding protein [Lachnospiraceae bacterium]|nr:ABC transporter ATP-binding protein [Cuneatibacter sp.]MDD6455351.1 ABC transporter ATP-binding protein [Lachnospiraceae bacterium]